MCLNGIHCTRIWVGLSVGLDDIEYLASTGVFPRTIQLVASRCTDYAVPTPYLIFIHLIKFIFTCNGIYEKSEGVTNS